MAQARAIKLRKHGEPRDAYPSRVAALDGGAWAGCPVPHAQSAGTSRIGVSDLTVIESNEAFAAQACAVSRELGFPVDRTNPNGGAIALGHPIGAILTVQVLQDLRRVGGGYGLVTMCIGGGQGIALIIKVN
jgi:acetyl-CoA C-acetyltransferase